MKENKIALITGAGRSIGADLARTLAAAGFRVVVNYAHSEKAAQTVVDEIRQAGGDAFPVKANVASYSEIQTMFDVVEQEWGSVDILINNAGIEIRNSSLDYDETTYDLMMDVNLKGAFFCSQRALRTMVKKRWGRIVNISSIHETRPTGNRSIYSISKGAMSVMAKEFALEFASFGITANNVIPGAIRTDMNKKVLSDPAYEANTLRQIPAGFIGDCRDLSPLVLFLCGDDARYINGASIYVDGALSLFR